MKYLLLLIVVFSFSTVSFADLAEESGCKKHLPDMTMYRRCITKYKMDVYNPNKLAEKCGVDANGKPIGHISGMGEFLCSDKMKLTIPNKYENLARKLDIEEKNTVEESPQKSNAHCPEEILKGNGKSGCAAYVKNYLLCMNADDVAKSVCQNRASYDVKIPEKIKSRCLSPNKDSCILFVDTLLRCVKSGAKSGTCLNAGNAFAKKRDELVKQYGLRSDSAASTFEQCLEKGNKKLADCVKEVDKYMSETFPDANCDNLQGKQSGFCGDAHYVKSDGNMNKLSRALKDVVETTPSKGTPTGSSSAKDGN